MIELIDLLTNDPDLLPCSAAEYISLQRLSAKEIERKAKDIMIPIPTIDVNSSIQEAASLMIEKNRGIVAVLSKGKLVGVVTDWDITKSTAEGKQNLLLENIMTKQVISASPDYTILDIIRELEQYQISAMPVVENGNVLGMINSDIIAQKYIINYFQTHEP